MRTIVAPTRAELVRQLFPRDGVVAEVGVQRGKFALDILTHVHPRTLILVDAWRHIEGGYEVDPADTTDVEHELARRECMSLVGQDSAVSVLRMLASDAAALLADGCLDAVYIDADHTRAGIERELREWWPKVKRGGIVAGHDWLEPGQERAWVDVRPVVEEFAAAHGLEIVLSGEADWKSWAMRRPLV